MDTPSKKDIKLVRSLLQKKFRKELGLFVVEGKKMTEESLQSNFEVFAVFSTDPSFKNVHKNTVIVTSKEMQMMSSFATPSEHLAVLKIPKRELAPPQDALVLYLDGIKDPGNLGTIIRTADWFGVKQVFCSQDTVELYSPKTVQSTMGSLFRMEVQYCAPSFVLDQPEYAIYGAVLNGEQLSLTKDSRKRILVIGSESHGIRAEALSRIGHPITIPGDGGAESLNAAIAAGILLYAFTKT